VDFKSSEGDEAEESEVCFFVANGKTSVFLDLTEEHLDAPSPLVDRLVINDLDPAVFASGDNGDVVVGAKLLTMVVAVIAHVFHDVAADDLGSHNIGHTDIGNMAAGQLAFDNPIVRRDDEVQFGGDAGAVSSPCAVPPFEPPP